MTTPDHTALSRRIAEKVMGWHTTIEDHLLEYHDGDGQFMQWCDAWEPHENWSDAGLVLNRLAACGVDCDVQVRRKHTYCILQTCQQGTVEVRESYVPRAVCLAVGKLLDSGWKPATNEESDGH